MADLIDTTEMYLRTILELEEEGQVPMRARISERLDHSGPTVSQTIGRMERDGLVELSNDRHLELTDHGRKLAIGVMRKHRLAERLLADVIGLEWELVHDEACRWEHVMSEQVERKILGLIQNPDVSPYGNPIPGLDALGFQGNNGFKDGVTAVTALDEKKILDGREFVLRRIGEPLQMDSNLLLRFKFLGILPGRSVTLSRSGEGWRICASSADQGLLLLNSDAMHLFVESPSTH